MKASKKARKKAAKKAYTESFRKSMNISGVVRGKKQNRKWKGEWCPLCNQEIHPRWRREHAQAHVANKHKGFNKLPKKSFQRSHGRNVFTAARLQRIERLPASEYHAYMRSRAWHKIRGRKLRTVCFRCEWCGTNDGLTVHHLTYERLGRERDDDMVVLCWDCHQGEQIGQPCDKMDRQHLSACAVGE